jgi:transposase
MNHTAESLPNNFELLKEIILQQAQRIATLEEFIRLEKQQRYGASSEKSSDQGELFNEAEAIVGESAAQEDVVAEVETEANVSAVVKNNKPVRKPLPAELPRIRQVYELSLEERQCSCGCSLTEIGEEVSEQLEVIPAQLRVIQHVRKTYACKGCEENIQTADKPPQLLPKSNATAGTLAYAITAKYQDGLPLYRLSNIFQRAGIELSRQTLSDWVINTAARLTPVMQLLQQRLHQGPVIHCDETRVQVLHEPDKPPQSNSYMWVQRGGPTASPIILFHYDSSRSGQVPLRLLSGYHGALMTDGYEGYNAIAHQSGITHLCCRACPT